jgi:hypothetical protein
MTWEKFDRNANRAPHTMRRGKPCTSRSPGRPDAAYLMIPRDMVTGERVSIYTSGDGRIAFEFGANGDYTVRRTSRTSYTMRVVIPKALCGMIKFGLNDVDLERSPEGWLVLNPQTEA